MKLSRNRQIITITAAAVVVVLLMFRNCSPEQIEEKEEAVYVEPEEAPLLMPVSDKLDIPFITDQIEPGKEQIITFPSGTKVTFPACAFEGNAEALKVKYREFMNSASIMSAGIPMNIKSGSEDYLQSAGMMEVRVYSGEEEVQPACPCKVEMVNTSADADYNLYRLDQEERGWITKSLSLPVKLIKRKVSSGKVEKPAEPDYEKLARNSGNTPPVKPAVANPKRYSFHFKIDLSSYPELNVYDGILWEYTGKPGDPEDPEVNEWVKNARWYEMVLDPSGKAGQYRMTLKTKERTFTTTVKPVFDKEDMEYAMDVYKDRYSKYRAYVDKKKEEHRKAQVALEKAVKTNEVIDKITRSFEMDKLGIWNIDKLMNIEEPVMAELKFNVPDTVKMVRAYMVMKEVNTSVNFLFTDNSIKQFKCPAKADIRIIAVNDAGQLFLLKKNDLGEVFAGKKNVNVSLEGKEIRVRSAEELRLFN